VSGGELLPKVTLVTPAYNQAEYLAETIESVLAQDYPNMEYIVLDDGSTDDTPAVLERYAQRVHCERHTNMGQARTLNRGWSMAKGSLVGYISSDDRLHPHAVRCLVEALQQRPDAVVAYGDFDIIDAYGRKVRSVCTEEFDLDRLQVDLICQPGAGVLFRRELLGEVGGWQKKLRQVPDLEFWIRAAKSGPFVRVPQTLAAYRVHEGSASFSKISAERSNEVVDVMQTHWAGVRSAKADRSLARAHLLAARSHAQSGRALETVRHWWASVKLDTAVALSPGGLRAMSTGLLRRLWYGLRKSSP